MGINATQRLISNIGLCRKAGKTVLGVPMVCEAMRTGGANAPCLVLYPKDCSNNTRKRIVNKCTFYAVEARELPIGGEELARAVGKTSDICAVGVTDRGLASAILRTLKASEPSESGDEIKLS